jgi:hypothetical protein
MTDMTANKETFIMGKTDVELAKLTERVVALEAAEQARQPVVTPTGDPEPVPEPEPEPVKAPAAKKATDEDDEEDEDKPKKAKHR